MNSAPARPIPALAASCPIPTTTVCPISSNTPSTPTRFNLGPSRYPALSTVEDSNGLEYVALTFTERNDDPNLTYTVQVTSDLTQRADTWHSGSSFTTVVSQTSNGDTTQITVRDNTPLTPPAKRFIRVQVSDN